MPSCAWCARCVTVTGEQIEGMEDARQMITLDSDRLTFRFPEVHSDAICAIDFQRTLRIPDDGSDYPLPPGLGRFPLRHVDDHAHRLPAAWLRRGGVLLPMHQAEAMWLHFCGTTGYPFAVKVATGKICAVTGEAWAERLNRDPQDYLVVPDQPWLDGYCVEKGVIRQFVAMPLGAGYTVEEQLTGAAEHGGLQIIAFPMKRQRYEQMQRERPQEVFACYEMAPQAPLKSMGLAPGGRMRQEIYDDPYGLDAWDQRHASRCFVSIVNSRQWQAITGERPPTQRPTAAQYADAGLPWFDFYRDLAAVEATDKLTGVSSVAAIAAQKADPPLPANRTISPGNVISLGSPRPAPSRRQVREMPLP